MWGFLNWKTRNCGVAQTAESRRTIKHRNSRESERERQRKESLLRRRSDYRDNNGGRTDSNNACSESVNHQGLSTPFHKQQKGFRMDSPEDRPLQHLWFQVPLPPCPSAWWRRYLLLLLLFSSSFLYRLFSWCWSVTMWNAMLFCYLFPVFWNLSSLRWTPTFNLMIS